MRPGMPLKSTRWRLADSKPDLLSEPPSRITKSMVAHVLEDPSRRDIAVCFTGHRHLYPVMIPHITWRLDTELARLYEMGYRDFLCGGALGFDMLAAERVMRLRNFQKDVRLIMVIPCVDQCKHWSEEDCRRYERILYIADETQVLSKAYYEGCMLVRNRYMVDRSSMCICYMLTPTGGTLSTVSYALQQDLPVVNLAMDLPPAGLYETPDAEE